MRRFLTLVSLLCLTIPVGVSISGCVRNPAGKYCPNPDYDLLTTQVASITLTPVSGGISLAYGQTKQITPPIANTCLGSTATVNSNQYTFGTTNNQLVDISPVGTMCAGTWNRNTGGGIANYTICYPPNPLPSTGGLPYSSAYVTAENSSVTSNPVQVFVHAPVTSVSLVGPQQCLSQNEVAQLDAQACYASNGQQVLLCAPSSVTTAPSPTLACPLPPGQTLASIPSCSASIGTLQFQISNSAVATLSSLTNQITAELPGTTAITASIAGSGSSAGYFSTCPPASIDVTLANGKTSGTISQGVQQNMTTTVTDTQGAQITGLSLDYQSTNPIDITAGSAGAISTTHPGVASIYAVCQPPTCNPSPINVTGLNGTGLSISSNPVTVTTPGSTSDFVWFGAPGQSQYFVPIELLTGTLGSNVRLPYVPNSMLMDQLGASLYFGSARELMVFTTVTNGITKTDTNAPGVVLAVSPSATSLLINDQARHLFYIYSLTSGNISSFGGMGEAAAWTPDSKTLYIVDNANLNTPATCSTLNITGHMDMLYVYSLNTGWSTYKLPPSPLPPDAMPTCDTQPNVAPPAPLQTPAITIPGVGAYLRGLPTDAHTWCPSGTAGNAASVQYYPEGDSVDVQTDVLAATGDGDHILGATCSNPAPSGVCAAVNLYDIGVTIPTSACSVTTTGSGATQVQTLNPLLISHSINSTDPIPLTQVMNATAVNQVVPGSFPELASSTAQATGLAFITYIGNTPGALLPYYTPGACTPGTGGAAPTCAPGTVNYVTLMNGTVPSTTVTAPLAGTFSPDNNIFFVSTAGDDQIHFIALPNTATGTPKDTQQISPNLPACTPVPPAGNGTDPGCTLTTAPTPSIVPATVIIVKPRSIT